MDMFDLASTLFGGRGNPVAQGSSLTATGSAASEDGTAYLVMDADVTPAEGVGDDTDQTVIDVPTSPSVAEGDEVIMTLVGDGPLKTPVVMANPGSGDRMQTQVDNAETLAEQAEAVATATGQHFWPDTDGVHVTEVTQDEWSDSTSPSYHSGANVLLNALGQLFRDGLNNILAIVSGTDPGIAIYDGSGNSAENILALLTKSLIRLGGRFAASGRSTAKVQFFEDDSALTDLTAEHYIDTTTEPQVSHDLALSATTTDDELPDGTSRTVTGNVEVWEQIYNDGSTYSDEVTASLNGATTNRQYNASMGVRVIEASGGQVERTAFAVADNLRLTHGTGSQASTSDIAMEQVIVGLTQPGGTWTGANGTATDGSNAWRRCSFTTRIAGAGAWSDYFTLSGGTITALKDVVLEISGNMYWNSGAVAQYGFGLFTGGTFNSTGYLSNGTGEVSNFSYKGVSGGQFSVPFPPRFFHMTAGSHLYVCRYTHSGAVYRNGNNMSFVTIKVIEDRSS